GWGWMQIFSRGWPKAISFTTATRAGSISRSTRPISAKASFSRSSSAGAPMPAMARSMRLSVLPPRSALSDRQRYRRGRSGPAVGRLGTLRLVFHADFLERAPDDAAGLRAMAGHDQLEPIRYAGHARDLELGPGIRDVAHDAGHGGKPHGDGRFDIGIAAGRNPAFEKERRGRRTGRFSEGHRSSLQEAFGQPSGRALPSS